jgi:CRP-like cAMP-binding protein
VSAPAALGFEEVLEGRPLTRTASAVTSVVCLALPADTFLTMLSDNRELAQGVFRLVLASRSSGVWVSTAGEPAGARPPRVPDDDAAAVRAAAGASGPPAASGLSVLDKALLLRRTPLLGRASVDQLMALAAVAREAPIAGNRVLATEDDSPAIYHVLAGSLRIESAGAAPGVIGPGATVGAAETLAGAATRWRVTGEREGTVLTLGRDELFDVLSGHVDLLQGLFSGALRSQRADAPSAPVAAAAGDGRRAHL